MEFFLVYIFSHYSINPIIQSEYDKIRGRKKSVFVHFHRNVKFQGVAVQEHSQYLI